MNLLKRRVVRLSARGERLETSLLFLTDGARPPGTRLSQGVDSQRWTVCSLFTLIVSADGAMMRHLELHQLPAEHRMTLEEVFKPAVQRQ